MENKNDNLIAQALDTKEGRSLLGEAMKLIIADWAKEEFSKWDRPRQERWMDTAFGLIWRDKLNK